MKKIILFDLVIVVYVILSSAVIDYRSEQRVASVLIDQAMEWNYRYFGVHKQIVEREKRLSTAADSAIIDRLKGQVLLQVESAGEMWYLNPFDLKRYYVGKARDLWLLTDKFGQELNNEDFIKYNYFEKAFPPDLAGRFIFVGGEKKETYYIPLASAQAIKLNSVDEAWETFKGLGLGVKNEDIRKIPVGEL